MDAFEYEGVFWLDGTEEQHIGRISFDPKSGASLKVFGTMTRQDELFAFRDPAQVRIRGIAGQNHMLLENCYSTGATIQSPGIPVEDFYVGQILAGPELPPGPDLTFNEAAVSFDQLAPWVLQRNFNHKFETAEPDNLATATKITIEYDIPPEIHASIGDVEVILDYSWKLGGDQSASVNIQQQPYLKLRYPEPIPLEQIMVDINGLQDLITLAVDAPAVPQEIQLWAPDVTREVQGRQVPVALRLFQPSLAEHVRQTKPQAWHNFFFPFEEIGGLEAVARWVGISRTYRPVLGSLLSIKYSARLYEENRFLNVISAAETLHRMRFPNYVEPPSEFKSYRRKIVRTVRQRVGRKSGDWLQRQLEHSNEPRLRQRLEELATYTVDSFFANGDIRADWAQAITTARNRMTHHDENQVLDRQPGDLHFLSESAYVIVMICLLRLAGVEPEELVQIKGSGRIQFIQAKTAETIPRYKAATRKGKATEEAPSTS